MNSGSWISSLWNRPRPGFLCTGRFPFQRGTLSPVTAVHECRVSRPYSHITHLHCDVSETQRVQ